MDAMTVSPTKALLLAVLWFAVAVETAPTEEVPDSLELFQVAIDGTEKSVTAIRSGERLLLYAKQLGAAFQYETKLVSKGRLLTFCLTGEQELCIPVSLRGVHTIEKGDGLFVEASTLVRALRLEVKDESEHVVIFKVAAKPGDEFEVPGFNAAWGSGRGFRTGDTLPDIPLMDMQGREVRFSKFLGKRYIIYCWASW